MELPTQCIACAYEREHGIKVDKSRTNVEWGRVLGVNEASIRRHREHGLREVSTASESVSGLTADPLPEITETHVGGGKSVDNFRLVRDRAVTLDDWRSWVESSGDDPEMFNPSIRSIAYGSGMWSNKLAMWPKSAKETWRFPGADELIAVIDAWKPERLEPVESLGNGFVICPADVQMGKGDYGLTHEDTIRRMMESYTKAANFCREYRPSEILIADLGDPIENINNTSSQRSTNTVALTEQIRLARRVALEGIKMLAPLTERLVYAAVPSNHGSVRIGPKAPADHVLDDYGIEIAEQLRDVVSNSEKLSNVEIVVPETSYESLVVDVAGTAIGMAHGHQATSADQLGKFWAGQSHGRQPLSRADIALFGHWHSLRVQQSGNARWLFVSPAQDNGSSWFTNKTGESSTTGMLSFTTSFGEWDHLRVL